MNDAFGWWAHKNLKERKGMEKIITLLLNDGAIPRSRKKEPSQPPTTPTKCDGGVLRGLKLMNR
jgi:hypothetical protein